MKFSRLATWYCKVDFGASSRFRNLFQIYAVISISAVLLSIFTFCAETHPYFKPNMTVEHYAEVSLRNTKFTPNSKFVCMFVKECDMLRKLKLQLGGNHFLFQFYGVSLQEIIRDWKYDWLYEKYSDYFPELEEESEEDHNNRIDGNQLFLLGVLFNTKIFIQRFLFKRTMRSIYTTFQILKILRKTLQIQLAVNIDLK